MVLCMVVGHVFVFAYSLDCINLFPFQRPGPLRGVRGAGPAMPRGRRGPVRGSGPGLRREAAAALRHGQLRGPHHGRVLGGTATADGQYRLAAVDTHARASVTSIILTYILCKALIRTLSKMA